MPFVGCPADGQAGPRAAPKGGPVRVSVPARVAVELAYYSSGGKGVLAPRGVFGTVWVWRGWVGCQTGAGDVGIGVGRAGCGVGVSIGGGLWTEFGGSGLAQVFPGFRWYVKRVLSMLRLNLPSGPVATDVLKRRGPRVVEYRTPGGMGGVGGRRGG